MNQICNNAGSSWYKDITDGKKYWGFGKKQFTHEGMLSKKVQDNQSLTC